MPKSLFKSHPCKLNYFFCDLLFNYFSPVSHIGTMELPMKKNKGNCERLVFWGKAAKYFCSAPLPFRIRYYIKPIQDKDTSNINYLQTDNTIWRLKQYYNPVTAGYCGSQALAGQHSVSSEVIQLLRREIKIPSAVQKRWCKLQMFVSSCLDCVSSTHLYVCLNALHFQKSCTTEQTGAF